REREHRRVAEIDLRVVVDLQRDRVANGRPAREQPEGVDGERGRGIRRTVTDEANDARAAPSKHVRGGAVRNCLLEQREERGRLLPNLREEVVTWLGADQGAGSLSTPSTLDARGSGPGSATWQAPKRPTPSSRNRGVTGSHLSIT